MSTKKYSQLLEESGLSEEHQSAQSNRSSFFNEIEPSAGNKLSANGSCNSGCNNGSCHQEDDDELSPTTLTP